MNRITLNNNIQMPMIGFGTFLMGGFEWSALLTWTRLHL